jgi:hypothetical protein
MRACFSDNLKKKKTYFNVDFIIAITAILMLIS